MQRIQRTPTFAMRGVAGLAAVTLLTAAAPVARPEDVGLSGERLQRIGALVRRYIDEQQITGAVTLVTRKGQTAHFEATGQMDAETKTPMRKDGVFRMASMSKPVTGVAILMLMEEGKLRLTDPVSRFIPSFGNPRVAVVKESRPAANPTAAARPTRDPETYTVPADREVTIRDLMTHTSGLESGGAGSRDGARLAPRQASMTLATHVPALGGVPLDFQPGTRWRYSALAGIDTLGYIVEVASGMTFDRFLETRIFAPLGMKDTGFVPMAAQAPRIVSLYRKVATGLEKQDTPAWLATKTLFSGGGGLWSTAEDYARFAQMLANGGELNGTRLMSPRTVDLMASNHVGALYDRAGLGFGLTVEVVLDPIAANRRTSAGSFGWDGAFGTHFWVDRKEQLTGVLLIQQATNPQLNRDFENAVMQAVID